MGAFTKDEAAEIVKNLTQQEMKGGVAPSSTKAVLDKAIAALADSDGISPKAYFPKGVKVTGKDLAIQALLLIYGASGAGKTHLGRQLLQSAAFGPDEILFVGKEDVTSVYGAGAHFMFADNMKEAVGIVDDLLKAAGVGVRLPKLLFVDSVSGLAHGTQQYYREHPIEEWSEKQQKMVHNKFAEFGELGTQTNDFMMKLIKLPMTKIVLCTTYEPKSGIPELAVQGEMIPKFLTQFSTTALYLRQAARQVPKESIEKAKAAGTLEQAHRIVVPSEEADASVLLIERYLYNQAGGEVITKGHHSLGVKEKADLPAILAKMGVA